MTYVKVLSIWLDVSVYYVCISTVNANKTFKFTKIKS